MNKKTKNAAKKHRKAQDRAKARLKALKQAGRK
jgi:hypothetical protein